VRKLGKITIALALTAALAAATGTAASAASGTGLRSGATALIPRIQPPPPPPPTSGPKSRIEPNRSAFDACEKGQGPLWTPYYADRFHSCFLIHTGFDVVIKKNGVNVKVGNWTLQWIASGAADNSAQVMTFKVKSTLWKVTGVPPGPTWRWSVGLACLDYFSNSTCSNNHAGGYTMTVATWSVPHTFTFVFDTSKSAGGGGGDHSAADGLNYHAMSQWQMFPGNNSSKSWSNATYFRCDKAPYINSGNGGCIFYQVMATWNISLSSKAGAVAKHIKLAQTDPGTKTYPPAPGGKKVVIPGFKSTGVPLTRLYKAYNMKLYNKNRATAVKACVAGWGSGYSNGGKDECDEYPMAATFQGASTADGNPLWYSVQVLSASANASAGAQWLGFLSRNRILSGDPFWAAVVS
jgi:hypothetical protein